MCNNIVVGIYIDTVLLGPLKSNSEKESLLPMGCKEKEWNGKRLLPARQTDTGMWNATARQLLNGSPFFVLLRNSISCTPNTRKKRELNLERPFLVCSSTCGHCILSYLIEYSTYLRDIFVYGVAKKKKDCPCLSEICVWHAIHACHKCRVDWKCFSRESNENIPRLKT